METKYCPKCDNDKPLSEWSWKNKTRKILADHCKVCLRLNAKEHYQKNKQQYIDRAARRTQKMVEWYQNLKRQIGCLLCDECEPSAIDHHHFLGKDIEVSNLVRKGSYKKLITEINKGIFLCANCHRKHHAGVITLPVDIKPLNIENPTLTAHVA